MDRDDLKYYLKQMAKPLSLLFLGLGFGLILIIAALLWLLAKRPAPLTQLAATPIPTPVITQLPTPPIAPIKPVAPVSPIAPQVSTTNEELLLPSSDFNLSPSPATSDSAQFPVIYVVSPGDSTWRIAQAFYGNGDDYRRIEQANGLRANQWLEVGQELLIPDPATPPEKIAELGYEISQPKAQLQQLGEQHQEPQVEDEHYYEVQTNDSLWFIALKYLGDGNKWVDLYRLNSTKIHEPNLIYPGQILFVPKD